MISEEEEAGGSKEAPEGVSLEDIGGTRFAREPKQDANVDLMAALIGARDAAKSQRSMPAEEATKTGPEPTMTEKGFSPVDTFMRLLRSMTAVSGKEVEISRLRDSAASSGLDDREFESTLEQLERDGLVYKSGKDRLSVVDMES
jgi:hypothetical protein